jgi:hypothetical protein
MLSTPPRLPVKQTSLQATSKTLLGLTLKLRGTSFLHEFSARRNQTGYVGPAAGAARRFCTAESYCRFNVLERLIGGQIKETPIIWANLTQNRAESPTGLGFL